MRARMECQNGDGDPPPLAANCSPRCAFRKDVSARGSTSRMCESCCLKSSSPSPVEQCMSARDPHSYPSRSYALSELLFTQLNHLSGLAKTEALVILYLQPMDTTSAVLPANVSVLLIVGSLYSYEHMGRAELACESGCECNPLLIDGTHKEHTNVIK